MRYSHAMSARLASLFSLIRPRTIARTVKSVEDLTAAARELKRRVKLLEEADARFEPRTAATESELLVLRNAVAELQLREARLRAIYQRDAEEQSMLPLVDAVLRGDAIRPQVERCVDAAVLHSTPFPHVVLENLLPEPVYDAVIRGIPPVELFDGPHNKQRIVVPFEMAPVFSRRVWGYLLNEIVDGMLGPAIIRKFHEPLMQWVHASWPELKGQPVESVLKLQSTDGRILLRGRGYLIPPHRDPKWGFLTCLMYLVRPGDSTAWGTQLYDVDGDMEAPSVAPHWIKVGKCRLVKDVSFRANSALVFLNSHGAHGAQIPEDAEPPDLQRYIYQFRIGPTPDSIRRLVALLPQAQREKWSGKVADYA